MLNTPDKVQSLMDDMACGGDARPRIAIMPRSLRCSSSSSRAQPSSSPGTTATSAGSSKSSPTATTAQEARKYFAYDNVRDGILKLTEDMFGVDIRPWNTPKWDKLVEAYEMYDHGKLIGRFYFDSHPRPGKV